MRTVGCGLILLASCAGCCCGRLPTFGLWPELDEAAVRAAVLEAPFAVDHVCVVERHCEAVRDAQVDVVPIGWNPLTGTVTALVAVEATCVASADLAERAEPFVCAGVLGAVLTGGALAVDEVTESTLTFLPNVGPRTLPGEYTGGGGDWDWD